MKQLIRSHQNEICKQIATHQGLSFQIILQKLHKHDTNVNVLQLYMCVNGKPFQSEKASTHQIKEFMHHFLGLASSHFAMS